MNANLIHPELSRRVIGIFFDVYNELGVGFLESVYRRAMLIALDDAGINARAHVPIHVIFRRRRAGRFVADLLVEEKIVVELKVAKAIVPIHEAQVINYLRATDLELGLLFNFGPEPKFRRLILSNDRKIRVHSRKSAVR